MKELLHKDIDKLNKKSIIEVIDWTLELCDVENNPRFGNISNVFPMNWRFLTTLDPQVDIAFSRDLDSLPMKREMMAVNEFLNSSREFHFMRDHPKHNVPMMGGMWGVRLSSSKIRQKLHQSFMRLFKSKLFYADNNLKGPDQYILAKYIYPWAKYFAMSHDSYFCKGDINSEPFPTKRENGICNFVGCIPELNSTLSLSWENECPFECRPYKHPNWNHC